MCTGNKNDDAAITWGVIACVGFLAIIALIIGLVFGLSNDNTTNNTTIIVVLPYLTPPVNKSSPPVFVVIVNTGSSQNSRFKTQSSLSGSIDPQTIVDRFFNPQGSPTDVSSILGDVDGRVQGINQRISQFPCIGKNSTTLKQYTLQLWAGQNQTFYAQCSEFWGGSTEMFDQFAIHNGDFYLYERGGETNLAAKITNYNATGGPDLVQIWFSVGILNRNGSHAVVEISAQPRLKILEMNFGGSGIGFCGGQLKSQSGKINITGSQDMGTTCTASESVCVSGHDVSTLANCTSTQNTFTLPAIGREAYDSGVYGASQYPQHPNLLFTRPCCDITGFGPTTPTV
jgi:hypothetical protein